MLSISLKNGHLLSLILKVYCALLRLVLTIQTKSTGGKLFIKTPIHPPAHVATSMPLKFDLAKISTFLYYSAHGHS